jgi:hypothetical protein
MIPNVFVSSTILDLHHLRDAVRDVIIDLGYNPVMSEYGDIGYLPTMAADESCYVTMRQCQLAILLVGKRYGEPKRGDLSVTHVEFHAARSASIPVMTLVDKEVLAFKAVADANASSSVAVSYPGMDYPAKIFELVSEIASYPSNNSFLIYSTVADARSHIKRQFAHVFGDLLQRRGGGIAPEVKDILAEIKTLRHEFGRATQQAVSRGFVKALRFLLEEKGRNLADVLELVALDLELGVERLLMEPTFPSFLASFEWQLESDEMGGSYERVKQRLGGAVLAHTAFLTEKRDEQAVWYADEEQTLFVNDVARRVFDELYGEARARAGAT